METNTKMQTAGFIAAGILKLLWYLFLVAAGIFIFLWMLVLECSNPKNNKC